MLKLTYSTSYLGSISLDDFCLTRDDMVLEFSTLMLREPQDTMEGDCVLLAQFSSDARFKHCVVL